MIDTHTHLYLPEFEPSGAEAVRRAIAAGVDMLVMPNVDLTTIQPLHRIAGLFPRHIRMAMGLHPSEVNHAWRQSVAVTDEWLARGGYCAVGEIGVDLYWDRSHEEQQMQAFDWQVSRAEAMDLPVIVHAREAFAQVTEVLQGHPGARGVLHCWCGTTEETEQVRARLDDRWYFGIGGVVTFKNSRLCDTLPAIGLERMLLETDSPYLAPVPHRGRRNESAYLPLITACAARCLAVTPQAVDATTTDNARRLFSLTEASDNSDSSDNSDALPRLRAVSESSESSELSEPSENTANYHLLP